MVFWLGGFYGGDVAVGFLEMKFEQGFEVFEVGVVGGGGAV